MKVENLFLKRKDKWYLKKKLGCKFIRINTSDAERGYDTDYEVSKIQIFISKFKDKQLKKIRKRIKQKKKRKRKENERTRRQNKKLRTLINKTKCLKWIVKNILPNYKRWKTQN